MFRDYTPFIAKIDRKERYRAIINILERNNIGYVIQEDNNVSNIIVKSTNKDKKKIVIGAHYDNVKGTPGANDNAAGCTILINLIFSLKDKRDDIEFVFFDAEERFALGSTIYLSKHAKNKIDYGINLDMCGQGTNIVFESNYDDMVKDSSFRKIVNNELEYKNAYKVVELPPSDSTSYKEAHVPYITVCASTKNDLQIYKEFHHATNITSQVNLELEAEYVKTMHRENDTCEKLNIEIMREIYEYLINSFVLM